MTHYLTEKTIKCPICGKPYKFYAFYAGDQSVCPKCVAEAEKDIVKHPNRIEPNEKQ